MKTNLRAFAIGILFATGVMGVAYSIVSEGSNPLGAEEVQAYVEENDLHLLTKLEYQQLLPTIEVEAEEKPEEEATDVTEEAKAPEEKQEEEIEEDAPFEIEIPEGMATYEVTDLLETAGVIKSAKEFDEYLEDLNIATKVRAGTFTMKKNMTYKEAANVLIK